MKITENLEENMRMSGVPKTSSFQNFEDEEFVALSPSK